MRRYLVCFALIVLAVPLAVESRLVLLDDAVLPLPTGWSIVDSIAGYPYLIVSGDNAAELTLHRSIISGDDMITNEIDFRASVDSVVASVVMDLPESRMVSSTGLKDGPWASFSLEFESWDDDALSDLHHRLTGVLYFHPDGYQLLFTLWARAIPVVWSIYSDDLLLMQEGFIYRGPAGDDAFGASAEESNILFLLLPLMVIAFAQIMRRSVRRHRAGKTS